MNYKVFTTRKFEKDLKRLVKKFPSLKSEYQRLIERISQVPDSGSFIGNDCYKIRLAISSKGKGKSGGARVISYLYVKSESVYLLSIYDKSEKADLKPNELKEMVDCLDLGS